MLAFLQAYSGLPAFHASACPPRVLRVSIRLMNSDDAILITVHPAVYKISNGFKIKLTNQTNRDIYLPQGDRLATEEVFQANSFDSVSAAVNQEWIDQVQIRAGRVQK
jgi:hypothetical protein